MRGAGKCGGVGAAHAAVQEAAQMQRPRTNI